MKATKRQKAKTTEAPARDWKPRRSGLLYCSPACGGGCTREAYLQARIASEKLAGEMGNGWKSRVWENLGWHWEIKSPCTRVRISAHKSGRKTYYNAGFGEKEGHGSLYVESGPRALIALSNVLDVVESNLEKIGAKLTEPVSVLATDFGAFQPLIKKKR